MRIGVIDYGASNIESIGNALMHLRQEFELIEKPDSLERFDKFILPGVGAAGSAMEHLRESGFSEVIPKIKVPVLGLCLGLQLFAEYSEENDTSCLSIIPGKVRRFSASGLKVPHIGWNRVKITRESPLTSGIADGSYFYFVHGYYLNSMDFAVGVADYGIRFPAIIKKANFYAAQFHPEKSGELGLQILRNFCELC
ncbi:MAG TPA: imidazole glycerol phosphate synthase subunit HisH [Candidatus Paceibacterota bacterium]